MICANSSDIKDQLEIDPASKRRQAVPPIAFRFCNPSSQSSSSTASLELNLKSNSPETIKSCKCDCHCNGYDQHLTAKESQETKFVPVRIYSNYEYRCCTMMFKMKLTFSPEGFEEKNPLVKCDYKIIGNYLLNLNSKNKNLNISLVRFAYPEKLCVITDNGRPICKKMLNDVLLWKEKMIETEFCFVFDGLERKDMNKFYCKGAFNISHGEDVLTIEFSFFIDEKNDADMHNFLPFGTLDINQMASPHCQKVPSENSEDSTCFSLLNSILKLVFTKVLAFKTWKLS